MTSRFLISRLRERPLERYRAPTGTRVIGNFHYFLKNAQFCAFFSVKKWLINESHETFNSQHNSVMKCLQPKYVQAAFAGFKANMLIQ